MRLFTLLFVLYFLFPPTNLQLLINVKNQGGDVMQESITANVTEDTVTLEFLRLDGVFISQLVDFANEVEAMKVVIPAEEELGQTGPQTLCFLTHAAQADFIAPDAMAKLRQKNPGTVRVAEEARGWRQTTATAWGARAARLLSAPAARHCSAARDKARDIIKRYFVHKRNFHNCIRAGASYEVAYERNERAPASVAKSVCRGGGRASGIEAFARPTALINSFLSWAPFRPLSRLSYGLYVFHIVLLYRSKTSLRDPVRGHYIDAVVETTGLTAISLVLSLVVWLL
ncbi:hypothetical protein MSG28_012599, partial [Choristoneura fumiferana]